MVKKKTRNLFIVMSIIVLGAIILNQQTTFLGAFVNDDRGTVIALCSDSQVPPGSPVYECSGPGGLFYCVDTFSESCESWVTRNFGVDVWNSCSETFQCSGSSSGCTSPSGQDGQYYCDDIEFNQGVIYECDGTDWNSFGFCPANCIDGSDTAGNSFDLCESTGFDCTDTDGGIDEFNQGTLTYTCDGQTDTATDVCRPDGSLWEYSCGNVDQNTCIAGIVELNCGTSFCVDGACLACDDGTPVGQCSSNKPFECTSSGTTAVFSEDCESCGCPSGLECNTQTGQCSETVSNECAYNGASYPIGATICATGGDGVLQCSSDLTNVLLYSCAVPTTCTPLELNPTSCCNPVCANGCYPDGSCISSPPGGSCTGDIDCPATEYCNSGACTVRQCAVDSDCNGGNSCANDICVNQIFCDETPVSDGTSCTTSGGASGQCSFGTCVPPPPPTGGITDTFCEAQSDCRDKGKCFADDDAEKCENQCFPFFQKWSVKAYDEDGEGCVIETSSLVLLGLLIVGLRFLKSKGG